MIHFLGWIQLSAAFLNSADVFVTYLCFIFVLKLSVYAMEIPKMKIFIYVLTFLGYAWSGYGSNVINNLRDAVLSAESIFGGVLENLITVARKFSSVRDVLDAAVEENCVFKCPSGKKGFKFPTL